MNIFYNNKFTFRFFLVFLVFSFGKNGNAQTSICGKVTDINSGDDMISANVVVTKNGVFVEGETTDIDGNYCIQVDSGEYDMEVSYTGYPTQKITGIIVNESQTTKVDVQLSTDLKLQMLNIVVMNICIPIIQQDKTSSGQDFYKNNMKKLPTRNINEIILMTPRVTAGN